MNPQLTSQSFLGAGSDAVLDRTIVGVVGLSGGGSHVVQQLAHLGVANFVVVDDDVIEMKNLNRLVGGTRADVDTSHAKTTIAERTIKAVNPNARVRVCRSKWQACLEELRSCDAIFGCVDSFGERDQLERFARRFLIPYIDIGMDVHKTGDGFGVSGQVVLSSPGGPCLWCLGILTHNRLAEEAQLYGAAGGRPQVVWVNGVLASLGIGLFVQLVSPWHSRPQIAACCEFDGNRHVVETNRLDNAGHLNCTHFPAHELGDAFFTRQIVTLSNDG
jgi:hypothetical protein